MILWISCKNKSLLRYPRFLWVNFILCVTSLLFLFGVGGRAWGRGGCKRKQKKGPHVGEQGAEKEDSSAQWGNAKHPLWRQYDPCLIHSTRLRVLTWMVCDLDHLFVFIYECCYVGWNIHSPGQRDSHPCGAWSMGGNRKLLRVSGPTLEVGTSEKDELLPYIHFGNWVLEGGLLWYYGAQYPEQHPHPGGLSQTSEVSPWNRSTAQDVVPVAALSLATNRPHRDLSGDVMVGFAHHMRHDVKKNFNSLNNNSDNKKQNQKTNG